MRIIASMTTIPQRIEYIRPVIESVFRQSVKVEALELNIPNYFIRGGETYSIPDWISEMDNVKIFRMDDYGPITKIAPTLDRHFHDDDTYIWSIDDDIEYPSFQLDALLQAHDPKVRKIITRYGGALNEGHDFQNWWGKALVSFFEAFGGVLYPPGCIDEDFMEYVRVTSTNEDCRRSDDIVLSMYFNMKNVGIQLNNTPTDEMPYMVSGILDHAKIDALSTGGHREKYGRVYRFITERFGSDCVAK